MRNYRNMDGYEISRKTISINFGWWSSNDGEEKLYTTAVEQLKTEGWDEDVTRSKGKDKRGWNWVVMIRQIIE
jgi:hypothetical protein